ncbi:galactose-specific lectin nattectin-like [Neosynchiropus ocellatus]
MAGLSFIVLLCLTSGLWLGAEARRCRVGDKCPQCPAGWSQFGCHCYKYFGGAKPWADGELACRDLDGNLASIHSSEEHQFLRSLIKQSAGSNVRTFVGGHDLGKEGSWMWSDGSKFEFNLWLKGEPNNYGNGEDCMEINFQDQPNDIACASPKPYICAKPM